MKWHMLDAAQRDRLRAGLRRVAVTLVLVLAAATLDAGQHLLGGQLSGALLPRLCESS